MKRRALIVWLASILVCVAGTAASAGGKVYTLPTCPPGANLDGTQVFEMVWQKGDCKQHRIPIRIADFTLQALCFVAVSRCVRVVDMTAAQHTHYQHLKQYAKKSNVDFVYCVQETDDKVWTRTMLTTRRVKDSYGCSPTAHTIRTIDLLSRTGCVHLGATQVGCVRLPESAKYL